MRIRTVLLTGAALAASVALAIGLPAQAPTPKGPLTSPLNLPWPAAVKKQPKYPPSLTPAQELKTFHMAPGYQVQLVASEPLVQDPIIAEFDGNGRLWVVEMQGYAVGQKMVNMTDPVGDVAILEDTDGDGVYDKRTVFADKLILPRALKILDHGCALIGEPPNLIKACDTNGDLVADTREVIKDGFGRQGNIEHAANGLYWSMDNTINVSEHTYNVLPKHDGSFEIVPNLSRGQWGITQDDGGRLYRNFNTDALFTDYVPARYYVRNPGLTRTRGLYESLVDQEKTSVWPIHPTLGVNRGYRPEVPRPDGSAYYYQGVSSPLIYRGDNLPDEFQGTALVVDSPTNLVHLLKMQDDGAGNLSAGDFYPKGEFLASTDERFRPVSLTPGWDGTVYIVDMYRGVSQDEPIQTDYLKDYIYKHRLWQGIHKGRIYRIIHDGMKPMPKPHMVDETPADLVAHLSNPNGWWRDTAQQLLVQRNDKSVVPALKQLVTGAPDWRTRLQALWTLNGMDSLDAATVMEALDDKSADVRTGAVRGAERFLDSKDVRFALIERLIVNDPSWQVRRQLAASLGELPAASRVAPVVAMLAKSGDDQMVVDAAVSGLKDMEGDALVALLATPNPSADAAGMLAGSAGKNRNLAVVQKMIALATDDKQPAPARTAMLYGLASGLEGVGVRRPSTVSGGRAGGTIPGFDRPRATVAPLALPAEPVALIAVSNGSGDLAVAAKQVVDDLTWPGKPVPPKPKSNRTPDEDKLFAAGKGVYADNCAGCHQDQGIGAPHVAANLVGSKIVTGRPDMPLRVLLNGKDGSIGEMPPLGQSLNDQKLAEVLTYVRGNWGNAATPIHPETVKEYRLMYHYRKKPWTEAELQKAPQ